MPSFYDMTQLIQGLPYRDMQGNHKDSKLVPISDEEMGSAVRNEPSEEEMNKPKFEFDPKWGYSPVEPQKTLPGFSAFQRPQYRS